MADIYRDRTDGVLARRRELVRENRDELALLPHAVRRVVVARRARSAAAIAACVAGAVLLVAASVPAFASILTRALPGPDPAPLTTTFVLACVVTLVAYFAARATHEHRFAVAMSRTVLPSEDLDGDVERLSHEGPDRVARELAQRFEVGSAALPVAAAGLLGPVLAVYAELAIRAHGWPLTRTFEDLLVDHHRAFVTLAALGAFAALATTRRALRVPRAAPIAGAIGGVALGIAQVEHSLLALGIGVIAAAIAYCAYRLRVERVRIATDDPAAGSDVFTLRGVLRRVRTLVVAVVARITRRQLGWASGVWVVACLGTWLYIHHASQPAAAPDWIPKLPAVAAMPPAPPPDGGGYDVQRMPDGRLQIVVRPHTTVELADLAGLSVLPAGWLANITITTTDPVYATPLRDEPAVHIWDHQEIDVCATKPRPLGLVLQPKETEVTLWISATFALADCH